VGDLEVEAPIVNARPTRVAYTSRDRAERVEGIVRPGAGFAAAFPLRGTLRGAPRTSTTAAVWIGAALLDAFALPPDVFREQHRGAWRAAPQACPSGRAEPFLAAGDPAQALLLLEDLRAESVQRWWTGTAERLGDRLVVGARQRCFDGYLQLDCVRDLAGGLRVAVTFENVREQASNGRSQSYAGNPHRPDATGRG